MFETNEDSQNSNIYKPLKTRFWILFIFSIFSLISGFLWNVYQPIMRSANIIYEWSIAEINLFPFLSCLIFCIFIFPYIYHWNKLGMKFFCHFSAVLYVIGTFICLCPATITIQSILIKVGCIINSFGGLMPLIGAPVISCMWFPNSERSRATSVAISFNTLGGALSPLIGPLFVPDVQANKSDKAFVDNKTEIKNGMQKFLYLQASLAIFNMLLVILYFPKKPKYLPCRSSEKTLRLAYWPGFKSLVKNKQFRIVVILNFITFGINSGVGAVFTSIVLPLGITQEETGILNMICTIVVFLAGIVGGWLGDYIGYKKIVLFTTFPTVLIYVIYGLQASKIISYNLMSIYIVNITLSFVSNIVCPISFEMGCEVAFPVSEDLSTSVLGFATNIGVVIFLAITMIPSMGTLWIPYTYAGLILLCFPLMFFYNDKSKRKEYDSVFLSEENKHEGLNYSSQCPLLLEN